MKTVIPFSNGSEFMSWLTYNCEKCKRHSCTAKRAIEFSCITGTITLKMAERVGYIKDWGLIAKCKMFTTVNEPRKKKVIKQDEKLF